VTPVMEWSFVVQDNIVLPYLLHACRYFVVAN